MTEKAKDFIKTDLERVTQRSIIKKLWNEMSEIGNLWLVLTLVQRKIKLLENYFSFIIQSRKKKLKENKSAEHYSF